MTKYLTALALLAVLALAAVLQPAPARANGVPIRIPLSYLTGLSSWGPVEARGEAELSFSEAIVRLDARGLPALTGEQYQLWLVKSGTNKAATVGTFTAPGGVAGFTGKVSDMEGYDYDLLIITVEPLNDTDPAPSAKRSIGGFFTPVRAPESAAGSGVSADAQPATLPQTGDVLPAPVAANPTRRLIASSLIGGGALVLLITARRRKATR